MIKINLLGVAPPPSKMPTVGGPPAPMVTQVVMFVGALIVCFGIVGVFYKVWSNQVAALQVKRNQEKARQADLAKVKAQNERNKRLEDDLETRLNTLQALETSRTGPVELMSALGSVVSKTNDVFLFTLTPMGDRLQLKGQSGTVDSMANFMAYLKNSGSFGEVQLEQFYQDDVHDHLSYKFTLDCQFISPTGGVSPTAGGAAASPGGPGMGPPGGPAGPIPQGALGQAQAPRRAM